MCYLSDANTEAFACTVKYRRGGTISKQNSKLTGLRYLICLCWQRGRCIRFQFTADSRRCSSLATRPGPELRPVRMAFEPIRACFHLGQIRTDCRQNETWQTRSLPLLLSSTVCCRSQCMLCFAKI